ncbi:MAG: glycosyltransferase family 4 protein [Acidobacteria bacterium]|nr:glycosyltransferase family 4 protein [Acidobacteriota bacterium]
MRIYAFTAGAASMYCGSCLRDNALAREMKAQGHDVLLLPVYTPTLVDEENVATHHVLFGGISVYLQQYSAFFRRTPWFVDRIWDSWLALKAASRRSIPVNPKFLGEMTVAMLEGESGPQHKEFEKMVYYLAHLERPDVVTLPNSLLIAMAEPIRRALGCPVFVTLQGEDLFLENLEEPFRTRSLALIRGQVATADGFVAVSEFCGRLMSAYLDIPKDKMHVAPLGVNTRDLAMRVKTPGAPFTIGYLARITPEKSLHQLCEAYLWMRREGGLPPSRIEAAGYLAPEYREYLRIIEKQMKEWGLGDEFHYRGALDREHKVRFLRSLDVLSVPSVYAEPKGLYALEAMACGVPVVEPRHGAFPEMIDKTGGGLLAEPDHAASFGRLILQLWKEPALAEELGRRGYEGVRRHYTVERMAVSAARVYSNAILPAVDS